ncbi:hypothetical protein L227DRAFT_653977 [Lentinus tigrinus ALCF2SS1-6]|uniref:F-box domain-containing protein n=1 Tax=Lentinus tigrinus ALCF2SS1-6 TaxID=1328759 RepID=A0A5C2S7N3_9APHY|nr:hypothetical protein L227DRAFT_653977 [Lentinus tigrinus ALCF2SS1-6]
MGDTSPQSRLRALSSTARQRQERTMVLLAEQERLEQKPADVIARQISLKMDLIDVRRQLNGELAVHQIPDEILVDIFHLVRGVPGPTYRDDQNWLMLHSVCHHWREVLCSTTAFWRNIFMHRDFEWTRLCFSRSQNSLLSLYFIHGPLIIPDSALQSTFLPLSAPRVRSLSFVGSNPRIPGIVLHLLADTTTGIPALTSLSLHWPYEGKSMPIPEPVEHLVCQLQSLTLHVYAVPTAIVQCRHLRSLRLLNTTFPHTTLEQLLTMLCHNLLLEELVIQGSRKTDGLPHSHASFESSPVQYYHIPIAFTRLETLRLNSSRTFIQHMLGRFRFPQAIEVEVISDGHNVVPAGEGVLSQCLSLGRQSWVETLPVLSNATALSIDVDDDFWGCRMRATIPDTENPAVLSVEHMDVRSSSILPHVLRDIIRTFSAAPMSKISLEVGRGRAIDRSAAAETWASFFRAFPLLDTLSLIGPYTAAWSMWEGLLLACSAESVDASCCPRLRRLTIVEHYPNDFLTSARTLTARKLMIDTLEVRARRGQLLQSFNLKRLDRSRLLSGGPCQELTELVDSFAYNVGPDMPELKFQLWD